MFEWPGVAILFEAAKTDDIRHVMDRRQRRFSITSKDTERITMSNSAPILEVQEEGPRTVVSFGDRYFPDEEFVDRCRQETEELVGRIKCDVLAFDLSGVNLLPSSMIGLLISLRDLGVEIHLVNVSEYIRESVVVAHLDTLLHMEDVA